MTALPMAVKVPDYQVKKGGAVKFHTYGREKHVSTAVNCREPWRLRVC